MSGSLGWEMEREIAALVGMSACGWREAIIQITGSSRAPIDWRRALLEYLSLDTQFDPVDWQIALANKYNMNWWDAILVALGTPPLSTPAVFSIGSNNTSNSVVSSLTIAVPAGGVPAGSLLVFMGNKNTWETHSAAQG